MNGVQQTGAAWARFADWVMGIYAWIVALAFGAALIDSIYSRSLADSTSVAAVSRAFSEASDLQQLPLAIVLLLGGLIADAGAGTGLRLALGAGASLLALAATVVFLGRARNPAPGATLS